MKEDFNMYGDEDFEFFFIRREYSLFIINLVLYWCEDYIEMKNFFFVVELKLLWSVKNRVLVCLGGGGYVNV